MVKYLSSLEGLVSSSESVITDEQRESLMGIRQQYKRNLIDVEKLIRVVNDLQEKL
jgi:hypothetical protein